MSKINSQKPKIPVPPKQGPAPKGFSNASASQNLDSSDSMKLKKGAPQPHNRSEHVGKTGQYLSNRVQNQVQDLKNQGKKVPATKMVSSYLGKADQNMGARSTLNTPKAQNIRTDLAKGKNVKDPTVSAPQTGGRLKPIAKVAVMDTKTGKVDTYNAKVESNKMVFRGNSPGTLRSQTSYPDKVTPLPKPLPGGQVPTGKVNIGAIGPNAQGQLRKVGAPAPKGPNMATDNGLGTQKRFAGMTKNATGVTKPGQKK